MADQLIRPKESSPDLDQIGPPAHLTGGRLPRPPALPSPRPHPPQEGWHPRIWVFKTPPGTVASNGGGWPDLSPRTPPNLLRSDSLSVYMSTGDAPWPLYQGLGRGGSCKGLLDDEGVRNGVALAASAVD